MYSSSNCFSDDNPSKRKKEPRAEKSNNKGIAEITKKEVACAFVQKLLRNPIIRECPTLAPPRIFEK